jgi:hypothetical protein
MPIGVGRNVMNHIVVASGTHAGGNVVQIQRVPNFPGHDVIRAGRVAAYTNGAEQFAG